MIEESAARYDVSPALLTLVTRLLWFHTSPAPLPTSPLHVVSSHELFLSLEHHLEKYPPQWVAATSRALEDVLSALPEGVLQGGVTPEVALGWGARLNANGYGLQEYNGGEDGALGVGLFPAAAMLNHSCAPNCVMVFK